MVLLVPHHDKNEAINGVMDDGLEEYAYDLRNGGVSISSMLAILVE
jgi:hypothetical protein